MKTMRTVTAISLLLILGAAGAFAGKPSTPHKKSFSPVIRYEVMIHMTGEPSMCSMYMVQLLKPNGDFAAPTQTFRLGVSTYTFYEAGNVRGIRIARLVPAPDMDHAACPPTLFTKPDVKTGTFLGGETYIFHLFPQNVPADKD